MGSGLGHQELFSPICTRQYPFEASVTLREWTITSGARLLPIGVKGPLPGKSEAMQLDWSGGEGAAEWYHQSAMVICSLPVWIALCTLCA